MKTKAAIFALLMGLFSLSGCVASLGTGPDYGYYPPAQPYYGYGRGYYAAPRPVIVVPRGGYYRPGPAYWSRYNDGNRYGGVGRGYNGGGQGGGGGRGYSGGGGHRGRD